MPRSRKFSEPKATFTSTWRCDGFGCGRSILMSASMPAPPFGNCHARMSHPPVSRRSSAQEVFAPFVVIGLPQQLLLQISRSDVLQLRRLGAFAQRLQRRVSALHACPERVVA